MIEESVAVAWSLSQKSEQNHPGRNMSPYGCREAFASPKMWIGRRKHRKHLWRFGRNQVGQGSCIDLNISERAVGIKAEKQPLFEIMLGRDTPFLERMSACKRSRKQAPISL